MTSARRQPRFGWFGRCAVFVVSVVSLVGSSELSAPTAWAASRTTKPGAPKSGVATKPASKTPSKTPTKTPSKTPTTVAGRTNKTGSLDAATVAAARGEVLVRTPAKGEPYRIGLLLPRLSEQSVVAAVASEQQRGVELAIGFVNDLGGIGGRPVSLIVADEGTTPESATKGFESLVRQGVHSVVGPTLSKHVRAVSVAAEREATLLFGASTSANGIAQLNPWVRRSAFSPDVVANAVVAELIATKPSSTATVVWVADEAGSVGSVGPVGSVVAESYRKAFARIGIPVDDVELPSTAEVDVPASEVAKKGSDVVIVAGPSPVISGFVSATLRAGSRSVIVIDPTSLSQDFVTRCSPCAGLLTPLLFDTEDTTSYSRALLLRRYFDAYGTMPTASAAQGFAAVQILSIALDSAIADERSPQTLPVRRDALRRAVTAGRYDTPFGLLTFDSQGEIKVERIALGEIVGPNNGPRIRALPQVPTSILTS